MNTYDDTTQTNEGMRYGEQRVGQRIGRHREGNLTKRIEAQTTKLPSDLFLAIAGATIVGSLALQIVGMRRRTGMVGMFGPLRAQTRAPLSMFVGMWAPTILLLGIYNKLVKVAGTDRMEG